MVRVLLPLAALPVVVVKVLSNQGHRPQLRDRPGAVTT
jgi:hypothetical protein